MQPKRPGRGATIYGSKGVITLSRNDYNLYGLDGKLIKTLKESNQSVDLTDTRGAGDLDGMHIANFFDSIRKDEKLHSPIADAGISTALCHYGNIAQEVNHTIEIDAKSGEDP